MAKIHTHYDNLKVARKAPQEVIRAAYKALSQKYHPDKNPGDEKAARIMAILNSAYGTLSDPLRRREHDDWIAAEEWEIAWLESTRAEEERGLLNHDTHQWQSEPDEEPAAAPAPPRRWGWALLLGLALGTGGGILLMTQEQVAAALGVKPTVVEVPAPAQAAPAAAAAPSPARDDVGAGADNWAVSGAHVPDSAQRAPLIKTLGETQLVIPARAPDCDTELHMLVAPNGEPWPETSGYLPNTPRGNPGNDMRITVDNSANASPVLVKVFDMERRSVARQLYVLANDTVVVDQLAAGRYLLRYQNVQAGGTREDCLVRRRQADQDALVQLP